MLSAQRIAIIDPEKPIITPTLRNDLIRKWANAMVNKIKESSIATWATPILFIIVLGYNIYGSRQLSAQAEDVRVIREEVIKLRTQKEDQEKYFEKERQELRDQVNEQRVRRENSDKKLDLLDYIVNKGR